MTNHFHWWKHKLFLVEVSENLSPVHSLVEEKQISCKIMHNYSSFAERCMPCKFFLNIEISCKYIARNEFHVRILRKSIDKQDSRKDYIDLQKKLARSRFFVEYCKIFAKNDFFCRLAYLKKCTQRWKNNLSEPKYLKSKE